MPYYLCWGLTFLAIFDEFTPAQIAEILAHADGLFERRPQDSDLKRLYGINVAKIPFEKFGYGLALKLSDDVWAIERSTCPPHARPGERILKARRLRERQERRVIKAVLQIAQALLAAVQPPIDAESGENRRTKNQRARDLRGAPRKKTAKTAKPKKTAKQRKAKPKSDTAKRTISTVLDWAQPIFSMLYNIESRAYKKLSHIRDKMASLFLGTDGATPASSAVGQRLLKLIAPSYEECRESNISAWVEKPLPRGYQRERRLFLADVLPIWLDTIGPIETMFVRGGQSIFGELFPERVYVA